MQFMNDDMDELFRRAAENYPLDTKGADFNKVLSALQNSDEEKVVPKKNNNRGKYLWLMLLLPMALVCNQYLSPGRTDAGTVLNPVQPVKATADAGTNDPSKPSGTAAEISSVNAPVNDDQKNQPSDKELKTPDVVNGLSTGGVTEEGSLVQKSIYPKETSEQLNKKKPTQPLKKQKPRQATDPYASKFVTAAATLEMKPVTGRQPFSRPGEVAHLPLHANPRLEWEGELPPQQLYLTSKDVAVAPSPKKEKKVYAGIMGGVDWTLVKFQQKEDMGYDAGLIVGYEFNRHWSVEAGAFFQKKHYYSDGRYYDVSKIYMPPSSTLSDVTGVCRMIELPVYARYSFTGKLKPYLSLGMTSYLMKQEDYQYVYKYTSGPPHVYDKTYMNASQNWFAAIHFSAGISKRLGKIADLRLEPYMKIPITGMGYGDLPLWSTGLHIGITRKLF